MKKPIANMKERSEEESQISRFKWEFLRRNRQYQSDYQDSVNGKMSDDQLRQKYGINEGAYLLDPNLEWEIKPGMPFMLFVERGVENWTHSNLSGQNLKPTEMLFKMDLRYPVTNSIADIKIHIQMEKQWRERKYQEKLQIEEELQKLKGQKGQKAQDKRLKLKIVWGVTSWPEPPIQSPKSKQIGLYETYLVVWDLGEQGKTFSEIAEDPKYTVLIPSDKTADTETVKTRYRAAKKLVEGGYKDI